MAAFHALQYHANAILLHEQAAMRRLSVSGPAIRTAASARAAAVSVCRRIPSAARCTAATTAYSYPAVTSTTIRPKPYSWRMFGLLRPSPRCGHAVDGPHEPPSCPYTFRPTAFAARQCSASCHCAKNVHQNEIGRRGYEIYRRMINGCAQSTRIAGVCMSLRPPKRRNNTTCDAAAASVEQLLLRPSFQKECGISFSVPLISHPIESTSGFVNTNIFFRTYCGATAQSESLHANPLQQGRRTHVEGESCTVARDEGAPRHVPAACSSFTRSNNGVDVSSVSSNSIATSSSHGATSLDSSTFENTGGGVTDTVERRRTLEKIDERNRFEDRGTRMAGVCSSSPVTFFQADAGIHSENISPPLPPRTMQPNAVKAGQTATMFTEFGNSTSRQQWDVHATALRRALQLAEFVSIDMELTGLHIRNEKFIGVDRCYEAHCEGARAFMPIQLGLCAARRADPRHPHRWILTPASIYIFPLESRIFQASTATLSFLRESGLDFNEWIAHGVPYMRAQEEREKRQTLEARIVELEQMKSRAVEENNSNGTSLAEREVPSQAFPYELATVEDQQLADTVRAAIQSWLASGSKQPLHLPVDNPLQRLLLHSLVASEFPHISSHSAKAGDQRVLAIYRSEGEVYEEQLRVLRDEVVKLERLRGVRQLLDDIADRRLVVVGHNCFYDLLHVYQTLYGDLPESVADFKSTWTQIFPFTFDTKLIAETHEVLASLQPPATLKGLCVFMATLNAASRENATCSSLRVGEETRMDVASSGGPLALEIQLERLPGTHWSLPMLAQSLSLATEHIGTTTTAATQSLASSDIFEHPKKYSKLARGAEMHIQSRHHSAIGGAQKQNTEGDASEETKGNAHTTTKEDYSHDAGYDSLMTCVVYLLQLAHVLPYHGLRWQNVTFGDRNIAARVVTAHHLYSLSRTQPASINLGGKDEQLLHQKRLLFMRNHPPHWKKWEIMKIWSPVWVDVQMVDESSSWIVARDEEDAQNIVTIYQMMKNPQFELLNYAQYRAMQRQESSQQQQ